MPIHIAAGDNALLSRIEMNRRVFQGIISEGGTFLLITGTAYFVYLGKMAADTVVKYVEFVVTTIGAGAQTAEVGLFSSPLAACKAAQSLTKLDSTATVDAVTSNGVKRNTSAFSTTVLAGTELWAGIRTAMATTQPTLVGASNDWSQGNILVKASASAFSTAGPWAGGLVAHAITTQGPAMRATID
jgi:hypothetical protein